MKNIENVLTYKTKNAILVYQNVIANVFGENKMRLYQGDFHSAIMFCKGLASAGASIRTAWCNNRGDIIDCEWNLDDFENAPCSKNITILRLYR